MSFCLEVQIVTAILTVFGGVGLFLCYFCKENFQKISIFSKGPEGGILPKNFKFVGS